MARVEKWCALLVVLSVAAASTATAAPGRSLFDLLPSGATAVVGISRLTPEKKLAAELRGYLKRPQLASVPVCVVDLYAKISEAGATLRLAPAPAVTFALRGAGLRAAAEACLTALVPGVTIAEEGTVTRYLLKGEAVHVRWLDGDTLVGGPIQDAGETAKLMEAGPPLSKDARLAPVLAEAARMPGWFAVDGVSVPAKLFPPDLPKLARIWGGFDSKVTMRVTFETTSPADAGTLAERLKGLLKQVPDDAAALAARAEIRTEGGKVTLTAPMGDYVAARAGIDAKRMPPEAGAAAMLGVVAAIALPAFVKSRRAKTAP